MTGQAIPRQTVKSPYFTISYIGPWFPLAPYRYLVDSYLWNLTGNQVKRNIPTWQIVFLALLTTGAVLDSPACVASAQSAQTGVPDPAQQKSQTAPPSPSQQKSDYSQEQFVIERFITHAAFQNDGTSRADLEVVVNLLTDSGVQQFGQIVFGYNSSNQELEVISVEGRKLVFDIAAHDGFDPISAGTHERHVIDAERFARKVGDKRERAGAAP